jgi:hypothetical protein
VTIAADLAESWQHVEGVEDVTFTPQNPPEPPVNNVKAKRRVLNRRSIQQFAAVALEPDDIVFHLWVSTLGGKTPKNGDLITDAGGVKFTILSQALESLQQRWRAACRKQA